MFCFKGEGSIVNEPLLTSSVFPFSTNQDLSDQLASFRAKSAVEVVFHAAALCDYRVAEVLDDRGQPMVAGKIPTRYGRLKLILEPAPKLLPRLREWFPQARIVGWKYELEGSRAEALAKGWRQIEDCRTDACVVNGMAYGSGYGFCLPPAQVTHCADLKTLAEQLQLWASLEGMSQNH